MTRLPLKDDTPPAHGKGVLEDDEKERPGLRAYVSRLTPLGLGAAIAVAGVLYGFSRASGHEARPVPASPVLPAAQPALVPATESTLPLPPPPRSFFAPQRPKPRTRPPSCVVMEGWRICRS